uniref:Uncharacterized protein LOC111112825 isoform X1 n=2 Tax=Crassostrea virginica TaxID=6565 RepID=A0A8B8BSQ6_CRAVI|nr:uncharacterized protein LOC111112825 isoform X1 [Crassostrea virginica]
MRTFKVFKVDSYVGDSVNISWTASFFPRAGSYNVYYTDNVIIEIFQNRATLSRSKYQYVSRPYNSTNIAVEIRDITADDAGHYYSGTSPEAAWYCGGVVLIVHDKPSKPNIQGILNIMVDSYTELTCSSSSTTAPDYYARLHSLSYTWYVNSTRLYGETNDTLRLRVTRNHKYNQYSCTARDKLESDGSDHVRINPLYTPDTLTVSPRPPFNLDNKLTVKEGETIGPYSCTADCNPPCDISWKYKDVTNGQFFDVASTAFLYSHIVNRSIELFRCVAKYSPGIGFRIIENIYLDVLYLDEPQLVYNENSPIYTSQEVQVWENTSLHLYCHVNGNPNPTIRLHRGVNANVITETNSTKWLNHTINSLQCSDTDEYTCSGDSTGLPSKKKVFRINVICDLRLNNNDKVELIQGFRVGSQRTVIIKVPVIAYPPPVTSRFTWIDTDGRVINGTYVVLLKTHELYSHLITSVVLLPEVEHYGEYSVQYNGKPLTKIQITKRVNFLSETERKSILQTVTTSHDETRTDMKTNGQENQNVQDLEFEKLKLENRKLHEEIQRTKLEKETLQAARNLYNAKLMLILKENKDVAPSILGQL